MTRKSQHTMNELNKGFSSWAKDFMIVWNFKVAWTNVINKDDLTRHQKTTMCYQGNLKCYSHVILLDIHSIYQRSLR